MTSATVTYMVNATAAAEDRATTTMRLYEAQWQKWEIWAVGRGIDPAEMSRLEDFLADLQRGGASMSAIRQARAGVMAFYRARIESIRQRPSGITQEGLEAIRRTAHRPRSTLLGKRESPEHARERGRLDVALIAVMRDSMLRPSEVSSITWANVEREPDGSGTIYLERVRDAALVTLYLGPPTMQALTAIYPPFPDLRDCVFPLCPRQIIRRIRAAAQAAGLQGHFTGESPRLGMAQDLLAARGPVALYYGASAG